MPKNMVLLSDGTGNSAAKLFRTNVWRLYQALDLRPGSGQVAYYDDGVGTSSLRPLAMLTGALGLGLRRNVKDLYAFLCQNYQDGDRIYAFGFSRGAFTIRVLAGMISTQGVIPGRSMQPDELRRAVDEAYKTDRKDYKTKWSRWKAPETATSTTPTVPAGRVAADIAFVGVWDTVDAYGMPIDELQRGLDYWLLGLSFPDQDLSPTVKRACHALALDDERRTFHPVLWNEAFEKKLAAEGKADPDRLKQVWFTGMHSNVGGGYAKDALAHVTLNWMVGEARDAKLEFHPAALDEFERLANPHADMGDSRAGFGAYYRYDPRKVKALCNDDYDRVWIDRPKIHHSVLDRIQSQHLTYVPHVIPADYDVVGPKGDVVPNTYETPAQATKREQDLERAWDFVWWRRVAYFVTLGLTAALLLFSQLPWVKDAAGCTGYLCFLEPALNLLTALLPDWTRWWTDAYRRNLGLFLVLALALGIALWFGRWLERRIRIRANAAWAHVTKLPAPPPRRRLLAAIARTLRQTKWLVAAYIWIARQAIPFVWFLFVVYAFLCVANRLAFDVAETTGIICEPSGKAVKITGPAVGSFRTSDTCAPTGVMMEAGVSYTVELRVTEDWKDGAYPVTPLGFESGERGVLSVLAAPMRRGWRTDGFAPIGQIGEWGRDRYRLTLQRKGPPGEKRYVSEPFTAHTGGELFVFVNDAVIGLPYVWHRFYDDNTGAAEITVSRVPPPGEVAR